MQENGADLKARLLVSSPPGFLINQFRAFALNPRVVGPRLREGQGD